MFPLKVIFFVMKQICTLFFSILFLTAFASAQTAQDTTYYTDEQGRTVVMIKQNQGAAPAAQQNGAIQTSPEAAPSASNQGCHSNDPRCL